MKRKLRWMLILAILAAFAVWLEPTRVVWGWLRGDAFYDGRPTSWWEQELTNINVTFLVPREPGIMDFLTLNEKGFAVFEGQKNGTIHGYTREIKFFELLWQGEWQAAFRKNVTVHRQIEEPSLLTGNSAAELVLCALKESPSAKLRFFGRLGLTRIEKAN